MAQTGQSGEVLILETEIGLTCFLFLHGFGSLNQWPSFTRFENYVPLWLNVSMVKSQQESGESKLIASGRKRI